VSNLPLQVRLGPVEEFFWCADRQFSSPSPWPERAQGVWIFCFVPLVQPTGVLRNLGDFFFGWSVFFSVVTPVGLSFHHFPRALPLPLHQLGYPGRFFSFFISGGFDGCFAQLAASYSPVVFKSPPGLFI